MAETKEFQCPSCGVVWSGGRYCNSCSFDLFAAGKPGSPAPRRTANPWPPTWRSWAGFVILAGALMIVLGSFLPWANVRSSFGSAGMTGPMSGMDVGADGFVVCVVGIAMAVAGIAMRLRSGRQTLAQGGALFGAVITAQVVTKDVVALRNGYDVDIRIIVDSLSIGLYIVAAGAVIAGAGALLYGLQRR